MVPADAAAAQYIVGIRVIGSGETSKLKVFLSNANAWSGLGLSNKRQV